MKHILLMAFAAFLISVPIAEAIPFPQGIDGIIYELDGITEVRSGINFFVMNENTGRAVYGNTGHGSKGRYSAAISGNFGDIITVKAWNKYNHANVSLPLDGVMHSVNFLLNMTYPPIAPVISSMPGENATEDEAYIYQMEVFDENEGDTLSYLLNSNPEGMSIDQATGLVTWVPAGSQVGQNLVEISVTDGIFLVNQSFSVNVANVNDQPIITTDPVTGARMLEAYSYDVGAIDDDGLSLIYFLEISPQGMAIDSVTGAISWRPTRKQLGLNHVVVSVTDGSLTASQDFYINVLPKKQGQNKGASGKVSRASTFKIQVQDGSWIAVNAQKEDVELEVEELKERPKEVRSIGKRVYKYLAIENINQAGIDDIQNAEINFSISSDWLEQNGISEQDIVLARHSNSKWHDLETTFLENRENFAYYTAKTPGFSYFAISVRDGIQVKNIINPQISKIEIPFRIYGSVYRFMRLGQAKEGTVISIENLNTGEVTKTATGGANSGSYYTFINGHLGDPIKLRINDLEQEFSTKLEDIENLNFMLNFRNTKFIAMDDNFFGSLLRESYLIVAMAALLASLVLGRIIILKRRKDKD